METNYVDILLLIIALIIVFVLMYAEYLSQDCKPGKNCTHNKPLPLPTDDIETSLEKIRILIMENYTFVTWRLSLIGAIIGTILIVYLLKGRIPNLAEYILVGLIIFFAIYFAFNFLVSNFFKPNGQVIQLQVEALKAKMLNEINQVNEINLNRTII